MALAYLAQADHCAEVVNRDPRWQTVVGALVVYSKRLMVLAAGPEADPDEAATQLVSIQGDAAQLDAAQFDAAQLDAAERGRAEGNVLAAAQDGDDQVSALGQALSGLLGALTNEVRAETVQAFVLRAGPSADRIARLVIDQLRLEVQRFALRKEALCAALGRDDRVVFDEQDALRFLARSSSADRLAHSRELARMLEQERRHQAAIADLQSFVRVHHTLLHELSGDDYDDEATQQEVLDALTHVDPAELSSKEIATCPRPLK
jgi:hypothetical protein